MRYLALVILPFIYLSCASNKKAELSENERKAEIYYGQGTQELVDKKYTDAIRNLMIAFKYNPKSSKIANHLGMAYYFKDRKMTAIKYIEKSLKLDPNNTQAKQNYGNLLMNTNSFEKAETVFKDILEDLTYKNQFQTYYNLGILKLKTQNYAQAVNFFKQSIDENSNFCPAHFELGKIYYKKNQFQEAYKKYHKASLGICYNNPEPRYHQALSLIKLKKYDQAEKVLHDITERFSLTPYERKARLVLNSLDKIKEKEERRILDGQILTPNF